jgi:anti-sigma factor RsiW
MECRDWRERISASIDGEIPPAEARLVEEHLAECAQCRALERKMRAVGIGIVMAEGVVPPDFREKLFARMEAENLLPRRRSLFVFSLRWAAVPAAAAAALALFLLTSTEKGKAPVSPQGPLPQVAGRSPVTDPVKPASPAVSPPPTSPDAAGPQGAPPRTAGLPQTEATRTGDPQLTPEDREIIAHLDILEDPAALDAAGEVDEVDELEIFAPAGRSRG